MQWLIVLLALANAVLIAVFLWKSPQGRRGFLILACSIWSVSRPTRRILHFVWEKTVHAPIRLDIFVTEWPLDPWNYIRHRRNLSCEVVRATRYAEDRAF